jgi:hypothetical protein
MAVKLISNETALSFCFPNGLFTQGFTIRHHQIQLLPFEISAIILIDPNSLHFFES